MVECLPVELPGLSCGRLPDFCKVCGMAFSVPIVEIDGRGFASPHPEPGYLDDLVADMEAVSGPVDESLVDEMTVRYFK